MDRSNPGSIKSGYAISAARAPAFETPYRKYGSSRRGWSDRENHACATTLVVERTKNGSPTLAVSATRTPSAGEASTFTIRSGNASATATASARCAQRAPPSEILRWARSA